jgi:dTDP-glucose 4,6-dehydratase
MDSAPMTAPFTTPIWLVTGGLGFIGSHFIRTVLNERPDVRVVNFDAVTYAANPANLADVCNSPRYNFVRGDIADEGAVAEVLTSYSVDVIVNFAAETHVDRSILDAAAFLRTDVIGTHVLLEAVRKFAVRRFVQVSTDEVYGHVNTGSSTEQAPLAPRSPYAASKAGGDLQVLAYVATYGVPALITRGSNTFGSHQFPEKLIPLFATNLFEDRPVPLYGDGLQIRDWLHAEDHARGILHALEHGSEGEVYNIGGGNPRTNLEITQRLLELCGRSFDTHVEHVVDRPGHDRRYALDCAKIHKLGWAPRHDFERALAETVAWYRENEAWWRPLKGGDFAAYYERQYSGRRA